jgi:hypothetical protein
MSTLAAAVPATATAAELEGRTVKAYEAYLAEARRAFVSARRTVSDATAKGDGVLSAGPAREDGIIDVPGGLVHHWSARAFIRGATLARALEVSRAYADYPRLYKSVLSARVLAHDGDTYRVLMRLKEGEAGVNAILDIRSTVQYSRPDARTVLALSHADEIREVTGAGTDERLLPAGRDSGYLWRANTFTYLAEHPQGLYVEMESIGLSRGFPPLLGWIIEPIARRLGRKSVETSLQEFLAGIRSRSSRS